MKSSFKSQQPKFKRSHQELMQLSCNGKSHSQKLMSVENMHHTAVLSVLHLLPDGEAQMSLMPEFKDCDPRAISYHHKPKNRVN